MLTTFLSAIKSVISNYFYGPLFLQPMPQKQFLFPVTNESGRIERILSKKKSLREKKTFRLLPVQFNFKLDILISAKSGIHTVAKKSFKFLLFAATEHHF
jgi:hypothetical protein